MGISPQLCTHRMAASGACQARQALFEQGHKCSCAGGVSQQALEVQLPPNFIRSLSQWSPKPKPQARPKEAKGWKMWVRVPFCRTWARSGISRHLKHFFDSSIAHAICKDFFG